MAKQSEMDALLKKLKKSVDKPVENENENKNDDGEINSLLSDLLSKYESSSAGDAVNIKAEEVTEDPITEDEPTDEKVTEDPIIEDEPTAEEVTEDPIIEDEPTDEKITEDPITEDDPEDYNTSFITSRDEYTVDPNQGILAAENLINGGDYISPDSIKKNPSDKDVSILMELGYENELSRTYGDERISEVKQKIMCESDTAFASETVNDGRKANYKVKPGKGKDIYNTVNRNTAEVIRNYHKIQNSFSVDIFIVSIVTLFLMIYDNLQFFLRIFNVNDADFWAFFSTPFYPIFGIVLLSISIFAARRPMLRAIRGFLKFTPAADSASMVTVVLTVLHGILSAFLNVGNHRLFNFPAAILLLCSVASYNLDLKRKIKLLEASLSDSPKYVLTELNHDSVKVENGKTYMVSRTECISGAPEKLEGWGKSNGIVTLVVPLVVFSAALIACIDMAFGSSFIDSLNAFMTVLTFCTPLNLVFFSSVPSTVISLHLAKRGAGIIGDVSQEKFSEKLTVCFSDKIAFLYTSLTPDLFMPSVNSEETDSIVTEMVDCIIKRNRVGERKMYISEISEEGIQIQTESGMQILFGEYSYLTEKGVVIPIPSSNLGNKLPWERGSVYVAVNGEFRRGYKVDCEPNAEFNKTIANFMKYRYSVAVSSINPGINKDSGKAFGNGITVIKQGIMENNSIIPLSDSGIFASGREENIALPLAACNVEKKIKRDMMISVIMYIAVCLTLSVLLLYFNLTGKLPEIGMSFENISIQLMISVQLIGCVPIAVSLIKVFRLFKKDFKYKK